MSYLRPDSSDVLDVASTHGKLYPLVAADDSHEYSGEAGVSYTMVQTEELTEAGIKRAMRLINIGFGNMIAAERIVAVVSPDSAPVKRLVQEARDLKKIVDATQGRRTRAVIVTDSGHIVLSAIQPETVAGRSGNRDTAVSMEEKEI